MQERNTPWNLWFLVGSYRQDQVMVMMTMMMMMMMMMESLVKKPTHTELDMNCHPGDSLWPSWDAEVTLSKVKWPPTRGSKDHLESPGCVYFVVSVSIWILSLLRCEWTNWSNHWLLALFFAMYVLNTLYLLSMSLCKYCSMFVDVNATCTKYHCMYKFIIIYIYFSYFGSAVSVHSVKPFFCLMLVLSVFFDFFVTSTVPTWYQAEWALYHLVRLDGYFADQLGLSDVNLEEFTPEDLLEPLASRQFGDEDHFCLVDLVVAIFERKKPPKNVLLICDFEVSPNLVFLGCR